MDCEGHECMKVYSRSQATHLGVYKNLKPKLETSGFDVDAERLTKNYHNNVRVGYSYATSRSLPQGLNTLQSDSWYLVIVPFVPITLEMYCCVYIYRSKDP